MIKREKFLTFFKYPIKSILIPETGPDAHGLLDLRAGGGV